jgi:cytochrome c oxidase subunit 2
MLRKSKRVFAALLGALSLLWLAPVQAVAAEWRLNMPQGVTSVSREVYGLHMQIFWWCVAIGVVVFGVMLVSMFLHRKSRGAKAANFHESTSLEIIWTVIPIVILIIMAWPATSTLKNMYDTEDAEMDILITGYQWKWKYEYVGEDVSFFSNMSTPRTQISDDEPQGEHYLLEVDRPLYVPVGKKIRFLVTAADVIHSWWIPDFAVKRDAIPGYINEAWTLVEEPGTYRGQCTELCGKDHAYMPVVVEAVPEEEFRAWLANAREEAAKVRELTEQTFEFDELYTRGEQVYQASCAACHGGNGQGGVGPAIAGGPLSTGAVADHIDIVVNGSPTNPAMQAFGEQLSEVDLAAVITFERNAFGNNMGDTVQPIDILNFKQGQ